ncbi:unnamed protein product [Linum trigynum]|uniref:Uncharacterized protein n=1 Tax=Linum trigynum TaxID=586398 RepID=A0AAV2GBG1_9ROSI
MGSKAPLSSRSEETNGGSGFQGSSWILEEGIRSLVSRDLSRINCVSNRRGFESSCVSNKAVVRINCVSNRSSEWVSKTMAERVRFSGSELGWDNDGGDGRGTDGGGRWVVDY